MKLYKKNLKKLLKNNVYNPNQEHDACGVGFIASTEGVKSRKVVEFGIQALKAVWHRGAVDADGKTGDGAGIHIEIPNDLSDTGVYVPVAYGTWGTTLKNPNATDRYPIPFLKSTGGDSTSGILYYTVPHSTSNAHDTAHYDKNIRQFVKVTGYQANTESSESVNNRLIRDTFERKYYFINYVY